MGTGFIVDLPSGLVSTCAHVVLDCFYDRPDGCLDPGVYGVAIGVGFGKRIRWVCRAEVHFISRPPANYDANACPGKNCNALMGPQQEPNLKNRTCDGCGANWTGLPIQKGPPPSHWTVQDSTAERLDLAILRLVDFATGLPLVDPGSVLAHSPGNPAHALRLGDSTALKDLEPLVMLGYGQEAGTGVGQERTSTLTRGVASGGFTSTTTGAWLKTDAVVLSGHSGGPMVNRFGDVIGWAVQSGRMAELRPVESLLAPLELVLSSIAPARQGPLNTLRTRLEGHATDRPELDDEALQACRAAMAGAARAEAAAAAAGEFAVQARSAVDDAQAMAQIGAYQVQAQMGYAQATAAEKMLASLKARGYTVDIEDQPWLRSPPSDTASTASPPSSPARSKTEMWLVIDGDFPDFDQDGFQNKLARLLRHEVEPSNINIEDDEEDEGQVAVRVSTGKCKVTVRYNLYSGGMFTTDDEPALKDHLKDTLKGLVQRFWPSGVDVESIKVKLAVKGSIILLIELPQPLPVLLMQLAEQRSAS